MKSILTILMLLTCFISKAQIDSLKIKNRIDTLLSSTSADSLRFKFQLPDSLSESVSKLDSSVQKANSKFRNVSNAVNDPGRKVNQSIDKLTSLPSQLDNTGNQIQNAILSRQPKMKGLDSARNKVDSMKTSLDKIQTDIIKIKTPQQIIAVEQKKNDVESAVNSKLNSFKDKGATGLPEGLNLPGAQNSKQPELPGLDTKGLTLPGVDVGKSGIKLPSVKEKDGVKVPGIEIPKLGIKGLEQVESIQEKLGSVTSVTDKASAYQEDLKNAGTGNFEKMNKLPDELEERVSKLDGIETLEGQVGAYKAMKEKWSADPEVQKEVALNVAKEQAMNHFASHEEELKTAMEQLSKVKSKTKGAEGVIDLFKKHQNTMKGKPFIERLVPGIVFQVQKPNNVWIDFNPYLGYRFFGRLTAGAGWNERWSVNFKERHSISSEHIYGPRMYVEFRWKDYLFLKAETEWMNIQPVSIYPAYIVDTSGRRLVGSSFAGIKNVFAFSKSVKGQVQVLYNLYNPDKLSPYNNRLNVRFGFEFPLKKKVTKNPLH